MLTSLLYMCVVLRLVSCAVGKLYRMIIAIRQDLVTHFRVIEDLSYGFLFNTFSAYVPCLVSIRNILCVKPPSKGTGTPVICQGYALSIFENIDMTVPHRQRPLALPAIKLS